MYKSFFKTLKEWKLSAFEDDPIIYNVENENTEFKEDQTNEDLKICLRKLWEKDPTKLLTFVKNFITRRKYQYQIEICLEMILNFNKVTQLDKLNDTVKENGKDLLQTLNIYKNFNKRNLKL